MHVCPQYRMPNAHATAQHQWNSSVAHPASTLGAASSAVVRAGMRDLPLFARVGAAIPALPLDSLTVMRDDAVVWVLVGGGVQAIENGTGMLYEDDGDTTSYETGAFATQALRWTWNGTVLQATIQAVEASGGYDPPTTQHRVSLDLRGFGGGEVPGRSEVDGDRDGVGCEATTAHSLSRPVGTVVCTLKALVQKTKTTTVVLGW